MVFSVQMFHESFVFGQIGVADFILDHRSGEPRLRPAGPGRTPRGEQKTKESVYNIGDDEIKDEPEKAACHLLNVAETKAGVNAKRLLLEFL